MSRGRGLAPLVGAGMAAVAAGSLVMFSLLAQHTALSPTPGDALQPRGPEGADRPAVVVPAPESSDAGATEEEQTLPFVATSFETASPPPAGSPPTTRAAEPGPPRRDETLLASLDIEIRVSEAVDLRGPLYDLTPRGRDPEEDPKKTDECPGRPAKPRAPSEHPHGGPPACGNPHGEPPGQDKSEDARSARDEAGSDSAPPETADTSGGGNGAASGSPGASGGSSGSGGGGGSSSPGNSGGSSSNSGGASHPHGAPPGQAKKDSSSSTSSGGGSDSHPGHPHGAPPGQAKK